jgi:hypothetical protein
MTNSVTGVSTTLLISEFDSVHQSVTTLTSSDRQSWKRLSELHLVGHGLSGPKRRTSCYRSIAHCMSTTGRGFSTIFLIKLNSNWKKDGYFDTIQSLSTPNGPRRRISRSCAIMGSTAGSGLKSPGRFLGAIRTP